MDLRTKAKLGSGPVEYWSPARHSLSPCCEMDITLGFGPRISGSNPDGGIGDDRRVGTSDEGPPRTVCAHSSAGRAAPS